MNNFVDIKTDNSHVDWDARRFSGDALNHGDPLMGHPNLHATRKKCLKAWEEIDASFPECRFPFESALLFTWTERSIKMLTICAKETLCSVITNDARIKLINGSAKIVTAAAHAGELKATEAALEVVEGAVVISSLAVIAFSYAHKYRDYLPTIYNF